MKYLWMCIFFTGLIWSGVNPKDYPTWFMETLPTMIAFIVLATTYKKYPLTRILYLLILFHCLIMMIGGHYTYAEVPFFSWIRDYFGHQRNNYDKLGHFLQGFVPALAAREVFIHLKVIKNRFWLNSGLICFALAVSAFYEFLEWWAAVLMGEGAEQFLSTQGYIWDTQADMFFAMIGSICTIIFLSNLHDNQLKKIHWDIEN